MQHGLCWNPLDVRSIAQCETKNAIKILQSHASYLVTLSLCFLSKNIAFGHHPWGPILRPSVDTVVPQRRPGHPKQPVPGGWFPFFNYLAESLLQTGLVLPQNHRVECGNNKVISARGIQAKCCSSFLMVPCELIRGRLETPNDFSTPPVWIGLFLMVSCHGLRNVSMRDHVRRLHLCAHLLLFYLARVTWLTRY